jgi:hypothetical protein
VLRALARAVHSDLPPYSELPDPSSSCSGTRSARSLARLDAQTAERLAGTLPPGRARNRRTLATTLGGIYAAQYERILHRLQLPPGLLPGVFDDYQQIPLGELAWGVRPDIPVLNRILAVLGEHLLIGIERKIPGQDSEREVAPAPQSISA